MFDEEPDGDPHGECAAEIHRLEMRIHNAYEVYAGLEGVKRPLTDREQYLMDKIMEMASELKPKYDLPDTLKHNALLDRIKK